MLKINVKEGPVAIDTSAIPSTGGQSATTTNPANPAKPTRPPASAPRLSKRTALIALLLCLIAVVLNLALWRTAHPAKAAADFDGLISGFAYNAFGRWDSPLTKTQMIVQLQRKTGESDLDWQNVESAFSLNGSNGTWSGTLPAVQAQRVLIQEIEQIGDNSRVVFAETLLL